MIRASIDIGSNSVLLLVADVNDEGQITKEIFNESFITSLGRELDKTKKFHPDSMQATYEALQTYKKCLSTIHFPIEKTIVTATEASRVATNAKDFFSKIKNEIGFNVTIITGEAEAYYTAIGVASSISVKSSTIVVMDMGGASTELIKIGLNPFKIISSVSLPVGSVRATDWVKNNSFNEEMEKILHTDLNQYQTKSLVCVAGSMTALASMYKGVIDQYRDEVIDGVEILFPSFCEFSKDLLKTNVENLLLLFPYLGKRAPVLAAGSNVAVLIGNKLKIDTIKISTRGLRYGTVICGGIDGQFIGS